MKDVNKSLSLMWWHVLRGEAVCMHWILGLMVSVSLLYLLVLRLDSVACGAGAACIQCRAE